MSITLSLDGQVAVVTGATRGIGRGIAETLAKAGAAVALIGRDTARLAEVEAAITEAGGRAKSWALDVGDPSAIQGVFKEIPRDLGSLDILVNNAGITRDNILLRMKPDEWNDVLETNLTGVFHCMQGAARAMLKARAGKIINLTSVSAQRGNIGQANYAASKAGVIALTKSAAKEFAARGVQVNAIAPGLIETDMTSAMTEEVRDGLLANLPMGRLGTVDEIANAVLFLASPWSSYITGEVLIVDGGLAM